MEVLRARVRARTVLIGFLPTPEAAQRTSREADVRSLHDARRIAAEALTAQRQRCRRPRPASKDTAAAPPITSKTSAVVRIGRKRAAPSVISMKPAGRAANTPPKPPPSCGGLAPGELPKPRPPAVNTLATGMTVWSPCCTLSPKQTRAPVA